MGYLNNDTVVVDAILTKQGRKLLAEGQGLNISHFAFSDDFVDYRDYNADHVSGSAYYGEAIENLPMIEAVPNAAWNMRFPLGTRAPGTIYHTYISVAPYTTDSVRARINDFGQAGRLELLPKLVNGSGGNFTFRVSDITNLSIGGARSTGDFAVSTKRYPAGQIAEAGIYKGRSVWIEVGAERVSRTFTVEISAPESLAPPISIEVYVDANELLDPSDKLSGTQIGH